MTLRDKRSDYSEDYLRELAAELIQRHIADLSESTLAAMLREDDFTRRHDYAAENAIAADIDALLSDMKISITIRVDPAVEVVWG